MHLQVLERLDLSFNAIGEPGVPELGLALMACAAQLWLNLQGNNRWGRHNREARSRPPQLHCDLRARQQPRPQDRQPMTLDGNLVVSVTGELR